MSDPFDDRDFLDRLAKLFGLLASPNREEADTARLKIGETLAARGSSLLDLGERLTQLHAGGADLRSAQVARMQREVEAAHRGQQEARAALARAEEWATVLTARAEAAERTAADGGARRLSKALVGAAVVFALAGGTVLGRVTAPTPPVVVATPARSVRTLAETPLRAAASNDGMVLATLPANTDVVPLPGGDALSPGWRLVRRGESTGFVAADALPPSPGR